MRRFELPKLESGASTYLLSSGPERSLLLNLPPVATTIFSTRCYLDRGLKIWGCTNTYIFNANLLNDKWRWIAVKLPIDSKQNFVVSNTVESIFSPNNFYNIDYRHFKRSYSLQFVYLQSKILKHLKFIVTLQLWLLSTFFWHLNH